MKPSQKHCNHPMLYKGVNRTINIKNCNGFTEYNPIFHKIKKKEKEKTTQIQIELDYDFYREKTEEKDIYEEDTPRVIIIDIA